MSVSSIVALVMAAGRSTRFLPGRNKLDAPLWGRKVLAWTLTRLYEAGIRHIRVVVPPDRIPSAVQEFHRKDLHLETVVQYEPRGTADAVRVGLDGLSRKSNVLIVNGDTPVIRPETYRVLVETHEQAQAVLTLLTGWIERAGAYGVVERDGERIRRIKEAVERSPDERNQPAEINLGAYVCQWPEIMPYLERIEPNPTKGEYFFTDLVGILAEQGLKMTTYTLTDPSEAFGINTWEDYHRVQDILRRQIVEVWIRRGVHFVHPDTVYMDAEVELSEGVVIEPGTILQGRVKVGEGTHIGPWTRIRDCEIGARCEIQDHCVLEEASIGNECRIGPFARIRPGTKLESEVAIGNFVEVKKSHIRSKTKAMHLSYLGDAEIGQGVNVGAGTITCNYDGKQKHVTVIEDGVFIGSDTQLVAPVRVGQGAYIAAGTTVTHEVPPGSLAISRVRQKNIEGWVEKRRRKMDDDKTSSLSNSATDKLNKGES